MFEEVIVNLLREGHRVRFRATGESMLPSIRPGDYLLVRPAARSGLRRGEIVLALLDRGLTAHRIVKLGRDRVTLKGDSSIECDPPVATTSVLGVVYEIEREGQIRRPTPLLVVKLRKFIARFTPSTDTTSKIY